MRGGEVRDVMFKTKGGELGFERVRRNSKRGDAESASEDQTVKPHGEKPPTAGDQSESLGNVPRSHDPAANAAKNARRHRNIAIIVQRKKYHSRTGFRRQYPKRLGNRRDATVVFGSR